jgi:hypothetical protein
LLRRTGQLERAHYELSKLLEESQRDTETLGMLAAVWADRWGAGTDSKGEPDEARDALEQSQVLYAEGFSKIPTDTYTGIKRRVESGDDGEDRAGKGTGRKGARKAGGAGANPRRSAFLRLLGTG